MENKYFNDMPGKGGGEKLWNQQPKEDQGTKTLKGFTPPNSSLKGGLRKILNTSRMRSNTVFCAKAQLCVNVPLCLYWAFFCV